MAAVGKQATIEQTYAHFLSRQVQSPSKVPDYLLFECTAMFVGLRDDADAGFRFSRRSARCAPDVVRFDA